MSKVESTISYPSTPSHPIPSTPSTPSIDVDGEGDRCHVQGLNKSKLLVLELKFLQFHWLEAGAHGHYYCWCRLGPRGLVIVVSIPLIAHSTTSFRPYLHFYENSQ